MIKAIPRRFNAKKVPAPRRVGSELEISKISEPSTPGIVRRFPHASHPKGAHQTDELRINNVITMNAVPTGYNAGRLFVESQNIIATANPTPQNARIPPFGEKMLALKYSKLVVNEGCHFSFSSKYGVGIAVPNLNRL